MVFDSLLFIVFLVGILALPRLRLRWSTRRVVLLLASYLFYASWNPPFVLLLVLSTLIDWWVVQGLRRTESPGWRKLLLLLSLTANLGLLSYFKYGDFLLAATSDALRLLGVQASFGSLGVVLPVGISFYTFQTLSYTIDAYRREELPEHGFLDFALFVTFFPQLVAGPIVRARDFLEQVARPTPPGAGWTGFGLTLFVVGVFEKAVLADQLCAPLSDPVFADPATATALDVALGTIAFSGQVFFDFSGYSNCAIGLALALGFVLKRNFWCPYAAVGFSDFWRRWHISLSSWFRDYLYVPLGGSRGSPLRTDLNLMLVMVASGLWHGASWRFVLWGALHGVYMIVERRVRACARWSDRTARLLRVPLALVTYAGFTLALIPFRAQDIAGTRHAIVNLLTGPWSLGLLAGASPLAMHVHVMLVVVAGTIVYQHVLRERDPYMVIDRCDPRVKIAVGTLMLVSIFMSLHGSRPFVYFQF